MAKHICPPYLHILLGLVKKHHDLLEAATHSIDLEIADEKAKGSAQLTDSVFDRFVQQCQIILEFQKKFSHAAEGAAG